MRIISIVVIIVASMYCFVKPDSTHAQVRTAKFDQPANPIHIILVGEKPKYKRADEISFNVLVMNQSLRAVYIYGDLSWGYYASLTLCVQDAHGKNVSPNFVPDAMTHFENPDDTSQFVKLLPWHFLGTAVNTSTQRLNISKPGRYSVYAEYHSPISKERVAVKPLFGKEDGIVQSNVIFLVVE